MIQEVLYALNSHGFEETFAHIQEPQQVHPAVLQTCVLALIPLLS